MDEPGIGKVSWFRRSRAPLPWFLTGFRLWAFGTLFLSIAFVVGLGVIIGEEQWWARVCGGLVSLLCAVLASVVVAYLRRPVATPAETNPVDDRMVDEWITALRRDGQVEIGLSALKIVKTALSIALALALGIFLILGVGGAMGVVLGIVCLVMMGSLGLLPHLEFVTGARPAVRVDALGIEIARWDRLLIPWSEVLAVPVHRSTHAQSNVVVLVDDSFFNEYLRTRPVPLRALDSLSRGFIGTGFAIPSTTAPSPVTLAAWLDAEARQRQRQRHGAARQAPTADVSRRLAVWVERTFPADSAELVLAQLRDLPDEVVGGQDPERIRASLVITTGGDWYAFRQRLELAQLDWRDALVGAGLGHDDWPDRLDEVLGTSRPNA